MIQAVANISLEHQELVKTVFLQHELAINFTSIDKLTQNKIISFDQESTKKLNQLKYSFYNWDLLFSVLGPNDNPSDIESKLHSRIRVLKSLMTLQSIPKTQELHGSLRVHNLENSARFYTWLFGVEPREWTHRYVTFISHDPSFNFVLLVSDGKDLHQDTLYHLGRGVESKGKLIECYHSAVENGFHIEKAPRTTWRGTPLHELWLKDPDGTLIELYARLSDKELLEMPRDMEPVFLT